MEQVIRSTLLFRSYWVNLKKIEISLCSLS